MFLHTFHPSPILLSFGPVSIHWYGLLMVVGLVVGYAVARRTFRTARLSPDLLDRLLLPLIVGGLLGARLYHVLNELPYYLSNPLAVFAVWKGGLAIHGALVGGLVALWYIVRRGVLQYATTTRGMLFLFADLLSPSLALGQAIGRWGNYFNQELYGLPTPPAGGWGIPIDAVNRVPGYEGFLYFHPAFLYESIWLFITFIILLSLLKSRVKPTPSAPRPPLQGGESPLERGRPKGGGVYAPGRVFFLYLVLAGIGRFGVEFLRIDAMPLIFGVRLQQLVAGGMIIAGAAGLAWITRRLTVKGEVIQ